MDRSEAIALLIRECHKAGGQREFAISHGISPQYVNDAIRGRREFGPSVCKALGLEKVVSYESKA